MSDEKITTTAREALIAEILGDVSGLEEQVKAIHAELVVCNTELKKELTTALSAIRAKTTAEKNDMTESAAKLVKDRVYGEIVDGFLNGRRFFVGAQGRSLEYAPPLFQGFQTQLPVHIGGLDRGFSDQENRPRSPEAVFHPLFGKFTVEILPPFRLQGDCRNPFLGERQGGLFSDPSFGIPDPGGLAGLLLLRRTGPDDPLI